MNNSLAAQIYSKLSRAIELHKKDKLEAAEAIYDEVRAMDPRNADAWHLLGVVAMRRGELEKAKGLIVKAIKLKATDSAFFSNLGIVLKDLGDLDAAITSFDRALKLQPEYPEALSNRGLTLAQMGKHTEAIKEYDRALELRPSYAAAHSNRGISLQHLERSEEALASFRQAIASDPNFSDGWNNYAALLRRLRHYDESLKIYERALKLDPRNAKGFQGRGELLTEIGKIDEAFSDFDRALAINPRYPDPLWAKGFTYLAIGEFDKGWDLYDFRFEQSFRQAGVLNTDKPRWTPSRRSEKVLIWSEQGVGDELFFAQWLQQAHELGSEVLVAADARLIPAHNRSFQNVRFIDKAKSIQRSWYDCHLPLGSLPKALRDSGIEWQTARKNPHLIDDRSLTSKLRAELAIPPDKRVCGITWRSTRPELGKDKSLQIDDLLPIFRSPDMIFLNLQYGDTASEIAEFRKKTGVEIISHPEVDNLKDFDRHISLVAACDELVLVCNATAHVAGTLGKNAHLLAPRGKSLIWYWANRTENRSLWYPTIDIHVQSENFSWADSIAKLSNQIKKSS